MDISEAMCVYIIALGAVGRSDLLVWLTDSVLRPMLFAFGCPMSRWQRPAGWGAS